MKYYTYISDSKVDMLLPQIPLGFRQKLSLESGIDLKVFSIKAKSEATTLDDSVKRLQAVCLYINDTQPVGTIDDPKQWIAGAAGVKYGFTGENNEAIGFGGTTEKTRFLLVGSALHVVGMKPGEEKIGKGYSFLPHLLTLIRDTTEDQNRYGFSDHDFGYYLNEGHKEISSNMDMFISNGALQFPETVTTKIEFLARRMLHKVGARTFLLASPLYVAEAN